MGVANPSWSILGTLFRCAAAPANVSRDLDLLLDGFPNGDGRVKRVVDFSISENPGPGELIFFDGQGGPRSVRLRKPVSSYVEYELIREALRRATDHSILHAAGVVAPGGTCLITGRSRSGKTTLALFLWSKGLRLLGDDVCPIAHGSLTPEVFPRALYVRRRDHYVAALLEKIPAPRSAWPESFFPFPASVDRDVPPVTTVLHLQKGGPPEGELIPLAQSDTATRLLKATMERRNRFADVMQSVIQVSEHCKAYRLQASTPEGAASTALQLLTA